MATGTGPQHIGSHRSLLDDVTKPGRTGSWDTSPTTGLDAVVVPSVRSPERLGTAAELAAETGAHLVVLTSGDTHPADGFAPLARTTGERALTVLRIPTGYHHAALQFATSGLEAAACWRGVDTAVKRNLGLLLARRMGWRSLAFLDDDVQIDKAAFRRMVAAVTRQHSPWRVAGCAFPERNRNSRELTGDNSVVCHANRLTGGNQDTFIGGGAMAIRSAGGHWPFFPNIYNEDWLFLFGLMLWQNPRPRVALAGELRQLPQDPFQTPQTAGDQEFGDVLAEGLAHLLHRKLLRTGTASDEGYWRGYLKMRGRFIDTIQTRLVARGHERADELMKSLTTASEALAGIRSRDLSEYVEAWHRDLSVWSGRQRALQPGATMPEALASLDLSDLVVPVGTPVRRARLRRGFQLGSRWPAVGPALEPAALSGV